MNYLKSNSPASRPCGTYYFMKQLNQEKLSTAISFLKQIVEINDKLPYSADFDLNGMYNQVEIRVYSSKELPLGDSLLYVTLDLTDESIDDYDKIDEIKTVLDRLSKEIA